MTCLTSLPRPLGAGDVVTFDFPYPDGGTKTRTCLVLHEDPETGELIVVYGTSSLGLRGHSEHALILREPCTLAQAGLHQPTRFQLDRRIRVVPADPRFRMSQRCGTARLGCLPAWLRLQLPARHARLQRHSDSAERAGIHPVIGRMPPRPDRRTPFRTRRPRSASAMPRAALRAGTKPG
ncbi:MAG: hypothetical protein ACU0A8_07555 [Limimaricola soesokkakensis]|uniref:hypothetical protein n=1 Tax=Limimaricola soesokkakensis TaxID=1343159 RepID=UPI0040582A90